MMLWQQELLNNRKKKVIMFKVKETLKYLEELAINEMKISEYDEINSRYHRGVTCGLRTAIEIIQRDVLDEDV
jgi:hypothetical protein